MLGMSGGLASIHSDTMGWAEGLSPIWLTASSWFRRLLTPW